MDHKNVRYLAGSCAVFAWLFASYSASAAPSNEYRVKAAFIYNFTKFVSWENSPKTLNICINGADHFDVALKKIEKRSNSKTSYKVFTNAAVKNNCHLQIYSSTPSAVPMKNNLLTIGQKSSFTKKGGIISFIINLKVAKKAGLRMNPQLLEIADEVIR